jgi:hypothetical protein
MDAIKAVCSHILQYKSNTGGATGLFLTVGKQDIESEFFGDDKKVKDKSVE